MNSSIDPKPPGLAYEPHRFQAKGPIWTRINWRVVIFAGIVVSIPVLIFSVWLRAAISGGIYKSGSHLEVDLKAMSTFDMDQQNAVMTDIPEKFRNLEGKEVAMVGEMWAPQSAGNGHLGYFQLVYSKTKCCFSGPPLAQHFVDGNVAKGAKVNYYDVPVQVFGKLHVGIHKDGETIKSIYHVDVEKVIPIED